ncbi:MAG TPA: response regulator, partial [Myxococcota bacterium]|nr:response regulator [Myxococcota bacterium]
MADESSRVLVVDDEPFFREAICDALRGAAIECASAESSRDAFELALRPEIGAVVLDVGSSGSGGLELLRRLVAERPALRVIVLSAQVDQDLVLEALRVGACDYLAKPLHDEELVLSVRRALLSSALHTNWESLCARLAALEDRLAELSSAAAPDEAGASLADRAARAVADVLGVTRASLMLLDGESRLLRVAGATGCDVEPAAMDAVEVGSGVAGAVFAEGRALAVDDVRAQQRFATRSSDGRYRSSAFAVAPIPRDGKPIGVVCATERGDGGAFGSADLSLLRILALQVGSLLARAEGGSLASAADTSARGGEGSAAAAAPIARDVAESAIAVDPAARDAAASQVAADPAARDAQDAELARAICDAVTSEL